MAELEEELIGDDLDYEYDLDEEEEEALLAGEVPSHEVAVEDIIELGVEDDFGGEEDGHMGHSKSVHSRLHHPNKLQTSGRLQHANARYGDDEIPQKRFQNPPTNVYEEESTNNLKPEVVFVEDEEIQDNYDNTMNDAPVEVHMQDDKKNIDEEDEEEEDDDEEGGRDRFKSERSKISLTNTTVKRVIPDSLDQVQVKEPMNQQRNHGGRGRGRGGHMQRGGMRGGHRGGRGGMMAPPFGWPGGRGVSMGQLWPPKSPQQHPPLMMNPPNRMNMGVRGVLPPGMGRPNIYSLFGPGPPNQGQNQILRNASPGSFSLMGNTPWSTGMGPYGGPGILSQLIPRPQIPPPEDMRNLIKKRSIHDPMVGSPNKQMKVNQGPVNNQHMPPNQHMLQNQRMSPSQIMSAQRGGMVRKPPVMSRLSMPVQNANPNLTTIQTVDITTPPGTVQSKPQQNQTAKPPQNQNEATSSGTAAPTKPAQNQTTAETSRLKPPLDPVQKKSVPNHAANQKTAKVQDQSNQEKVAASEKGSLTPEEMEYQKKLEQQKKLREEILAKKEARRKAAANELSKKKGESPPATTEANKPSQPPQQQQPGAPSHPQQVKKDQLGVGQNHSVILQGGPSTKAEKPVIGNKKNPISFLHELNLGSEFIMNSMQGPSSSPTITMSLKFNGVIYTASAINKKLAKRYVAEAALKAYLQTNAAKQLGLRENMIDFTVRPKDTVSVTVDGQTFRGSGRNIKSAKAAAASNAVKSLRLLEDSSAHSLDTTDGTNTEVDSTKHVKKEVEVCGINPVSSLNDIGKKVEYSVIKEIGPSHSKIFFMKVTVAGKSFEGSGTSKKLAKTAAAIQALTVFGKTPQ